MKIHLILTKSLLITSIIFSSSLLGQETKNTASGILATENSEAACVVDLLPLPKTTLTGDVRYLSGGTCIDSVIQIKNLAKTYPLELVLVEKTDVNDKEGYIADVKVEIIDVNDNVVLTVFTEGPYLLVDLPKGHYQIVADFNGVTKFREVSIVKNKHSRVVMLWDKRSKG